MFEDLHALVYLSRSLVPFSEQDIRSLARYSALQNEKYQISGYLCFKNGLFLQYLEGGKNQLFELIHKIRNDHRHHFINEVDLGNLDERHFQGWDMRYLDMQELADIQLEQVLDWIMEDLEKEKLKRNKALESIREMVEIIVALRQKKLIA